ncbi:putative membrane protein YfcA [Streptomyces sp. V1I1]|nr:putative membrane protein YfcA [Streptomyces sp. V1I1]
MDIIISWEMGALAAAAVLVGFSKTAVSGANTVSLAIFAAVLPARESTGVLLPVLIVGDVVAVLIYRRHAHWPTLLRLFPAVAAGVVAPARCSCSGPTTTPYAHRSGRSCC